MHTSRHAATGMKKKRSVRVWSWGTSRHRRCQRRWEPGLSPARRLKRTYSLYWTSLIYSSDPQNYKASYGNTDFRMGSGRRLPCSAHSRNTPTRTRKASRALRPHRGDQKRRGRAERGLSSRGLRVFRKRGSFWSVGVPRSALAHRKKVPRYPGIRCITAHKKGAPLTGHPFALPARRQRPAPATTRQHWAPARAVRCWPGAVRCCQWQPCAAVRCCA